MQSIKSSQRFTTNHLTASNKLCLERNVLREEKQQRGTGI